MSTMVRPVTQIAEVAVKNASMKEAPPGPCRETGSIRRSTPTQAAEVNATRIARTGLNLRKAVSTGKDYSSPVHS